MNEIELEIISPNQPTPEAIALIKDIGFEAYNALIAFKHIKHELSLVETIEPHIMFSLIKGFVSALATQDPNFMHYKIVRTVLQDTNPDLLNDNNIIDKMARALNDYCKKLKLKLIMPKTFSAIFDPIKKECDTAAKENGEGADAPLLEILELPDTIKIEASVFEKDAMFLWDNILLNLIKTTGKEGKKHANEIKTSFKNRLETFKNGKNNPLNFWFNINSENPSESFYLSPALQILTKSIFDDSIFPLVKFKEKNVPALTTKVQEPLKQILSPYNTVERGEENLELLYLNRGTLLGSASIAAISSKIFPLVFNGIEKLNTVHGHRLIRYLINKAYNRKVCGEEDFRVIKCDRGATDIAVELGLSKKYVTTINQMVHAITYIEFNLKPLTGNLIQLSKYKSPITHRQDEGWLITVGTPLLPYQTFEDGGLLVPLLNDPPLVNPNRYHAGQYLLQMEVIEEFSKESIELYQHGVIRIPQAMLEEKANKCSLPKEVLKKVHDRWIQDGDDGAKFLEKIEGDFYTLGSDHQKALDFLKDQGKRRIEQSIRGKNSAAKRSTKK